MLQTRIVHGVGWHFDILNRLFKVDEDAHVILYELGDEADRVGRSDGSVGPNFEHQLFVIGHLPETGRFDGVVDLAHWRVNAIHRDVADWQVFVVVAVRGNIATTVLHTHFDLQLATFADRGDVNALIENREVRVFFDLRAGDNARLFDVYVDRFGQVTV